MNLSDWRNSFLASMLLVEEAAQSGFQKGDTELAVGEPSSSPMFVVGSSMCVKYLQLNIDTLFIFPRVMECFGPTLFWDDLGPLFWSLRFFVNKRGV